jgi:hypothetical protein
LTGRTGPMSHTLFTGWLRVPPSKRWRPVADGIESDVRRRLDAEASRYPVRDVCVLPLGNDPNKLEARA